MGYEGTVIELELQNPLPAQRRFLQSPARIRAYVSGLGAGKTFTGCTEVLNQAAGSIGMITAPSYPMLRDATQRTFFELYSSVIADHNVSYNNTTLIDGKTILWRSADKPDALRGPNLDWAYIDEADYCSEETFKVVIGRVRRKTGSRKIWLTSTPNARTGWMKRVIVPKILERDERYDLITSSTYDNHYLPKDYVELLADTYTSEHARQELYGEFIELGSTIMNRSWIRTGTVPEGVEIVVAADLAISQKDSADDTAIAVVGKLDNTYYVIDIISGKYTFNETQKLIDATATKYNASKVCIESVAFQEAMAQELRRKTMHHIVSVNPKGRDKLTRFMPIAGKYEHGHVVHTPNVSNKFTEQLLSFNGIAGNADDMVDAVVYGFAAFEKKRAGFTLI